MSIIPIEVQIALNCVVTETGCWEWQGATDKDGYGVITYDGKYHRTHSTMLKMALGSDTVYACHHCDQPRCCNPGHMYDGSAKANANDMILRKRGKGQFGKGEKHPWSKLTNEQVAEIRATPKVLGSSKLLAAKYGVTPGTISAVRNGKHFEG